MSKVKKSKKGSKNVKNNVVPFKPTKLEVIKNETPMSKEEAETVRVNNYAKEVCRNLDDFASNAGIDVERFYYNFLFYLKQSAIMKLSYPAFKYLDKGSTDEIVKNHAEFLGENYPELSLTKQETDTIH
tara:strand:+ start:566 stop:952 length:387 start_codon:yes stop_codon:yes gene_type:complete